MGLTQVGRELKDRADELSQRIVSLVWERVPGYEPPRMERQDLTAAVRPNVVFVLDHLVAPTDARSEDQARATELGRSRALQGVPLDVVVQSFRAAERVLDDAFVEAAAHLSIHDVRDGLRLLAEGFDRLSTWAIESYRQTQDELTSHYDRVAGDLVSGLVSGELDADTVRAQASSLGLEVAIPWHAVAARTDGDAVIGRTPARFQREVLGVLGADRAGRIVTGAARGAEVFVVPGTIGSPALERLRGIVHAHDNLGPRVGVGPAVDDLTMAGRSCRRALAAAAELRLPGVCLYDEVLLHAMLTEAEDAALRLRERFGPALTDAPHLAHTVSTHLETGMSVRRTAEALHVHPNTVAYRLGRVHKLTGLDPRTPADLVLLHLATRAPKSE